MTPDTTDISLDDAPKPSLYAFSRAEIREAMTELGEPAYRADQLWGWLYARFANSFEAMTNLSKALRETLAERYRLHTLTVEAETVSQDRLATKTLFRCDDGQMIETVLMHYVDPADLDAGPDIPSGRHTVCLSTQAGCAMGCVFCATGQMGLVRDLTSGECREQLVYFGRQLHRAEERLGNVVFMGMGEPLANWPATWATAETLMDSDAFGISPRRITISTVGIVPGILRLAETGVPIRLAVSLHAPDDDLRSELVPINATYPLDAILDACRVYLDRVGRRITFEYVLIDGVNDSVTQAQALAKRLKGFNGHVNLIPLNPTEGSPQRPSPYGQAVAFQEQLQAAGIPTTLRMRRGIDIQAGCGQLRSRERAGRLGRTVPATAAAFSETDGG